MSETEYIELMNRIHGEQNNPRESLEMSGQMPERKATAQEVENIGRDFVFGKRYQIL